MSPTAVKDTVAESNAWQKGGVAVDFLQRKLHGVHRHQWLYLQTDVAWEKNN